MMTDNLRSLSLKDKEALFAELGNMIQEEKYRYENDDVRLTEEIRMAVCIAMRVSTYDAASRLRPYVIVRAITTYVLLELGKTEAEVGRLIGRERTSIYHYRIIVESWMQVPELYKEELKVLNEIRQRYETDKGTI